MDQASPSHPSSPEHGKPFPSRVLCKLILQDELILFFLLSFLWTRICFERGKPKVNELSQRRVVFSRTHEALVWVDNVDKNTPLVSSPPASNTTPTPTTIPVPDCSDAKR
jgi:hypothetical protein